jgi:hypothetical protein
MKMSGFVSSFVDADSNNKNEEINEANEYVLEEKCRRLLLLYSNMWRMGCAWRACVCSGDGWSTNARK